MKSPQTIKDNQVTLSILTGYLSTALMLTICEIDRYDERIDKIFQAELKELGDHDKDKEQAALQLELAIEKHMKELKDAIRSDMDVVDLLKRILPAGVL